MKSENAAQGGTILAGKSRRYLRWTGFLGIWTLPGFFFASQVYLIYRVLYGKPMTWGQALQSTLPQWYIWAIFALIIFRLFVRLERYGRFRSLLIHLPLSLLFSLFHLLLYVAVRWVFSLDVPHPFDFWKFFLFFFTVWFHWNVLTYWCILGFSIAVDYYKKYQERQLMAAQLEVRLAQAQLQALKMQLHPHFLFNTINGILALIRIDPEGAEGMFRQLSDLLRTSLNDAELKDVPLRQELDFLQRYLQLESARFQGRLRVDTRISPEVLNARVPNLILQPLIENAVRHGIMQRLEPGRIVIEAERIADMLRLRVENSGPGLPEDGDYREGVGLSNTRARLQLLYGNKQRFELQNAEHGGVVATIEMPFVAGEAETVPREATGA